MITPLSISVAAAFDTFGREIGSFTRFEQDSLASSQNSRSSADFVSYIGATFDYVSGDLKREQRDRLQDVGIEVCKGPMCLDPESFSPTFLAGVFPSTADERLTPPIYCSLEPLCQVMKLARIVVDQAYFDFLSSGQSFFGPPFPAGQRSLHAQYWAESLLLLSLHLCLARNESFAFLE